MIQWFAPFVNSISTQLAAGSCDPNMRFLGLKPWYAYSKFNADCTYMPASGGKFSGADIWPIAAVVFEDLIMIAAYVALAFVIVGGFQMITSQGEPEKFKNARGTLINALIGLVIAIVGGRLVGFVFNGIFL